MHKSSEFVKKVDWEKRTLQAKIMHMRRLQRENLFWTPLGPFTQDILAYLQTYTMFVNTGHELFYDWKGEGAINTWFLIKYKTASEHLAGNVEYHRVKIYWDNIDTILTSKNKRLTFTRKETKLITEWDKIADAINPTPSDLELVEIYNEVSEKSDEKFAEIYDRLSTIVYQKLHPSKRIR